MFENNPVDNSQVVYKKLLPCLIEGLQGIAIKDIDAGNDHCLALSECGKQVFAWGQGKYGALGTSKSQNMDQPVLIDKNEHLGVRQIAAGSRHSAFVSDTSEVYMFGHATSG